MPRPPPPTHFLCIPLGGAQLARSLASFRADVTSPLSFGIPGDAVRPLGTLHLTLGVMALRTGAGGGPDGGEADEVARAVEVLRGLRPREMWARASAAAAMPAGHGPAMGRGGSGSGGRRDRPSVTLQGLDAMQTPSRTSVLYAPPHDPDGVLYRFCAEIKRAFQDAGLLLDENNRPLLLHATVVNTVYVRGRRQGHGGGGGRGGRSERMTIDARDMVRRYDGYVWAERMPVERVAICRMGAKKTGVVARDGEEEVRYEVEAELRF